jgi:uncharacterized UBP type Zn finger protein
LTLLGGLLHESQQHSKDSVSICPGCFSSFTRNESQKHQECIDTIRIFFNDVGVLVRPTTKDEIEAWVIGNSDNDALVVLFLY